IEPEPEPAFVLGTVFDAVKTYAPVAARTSRTTTIRRRMCREGLVMWVTPSGDVSTRNRDVATPVRGNGGQGSGDLRLALVERVDTAAADADVDALAAAQRVGGSRSEYEVVAVRAVSVRDDRGQAHARALRGGEILRADRLLRTADAARRHGVRRRDDEGDDADENHDAEDGGDADGHRPAGRTWGRSLSTENSSVSSAAPAS